MIRSVKWAVGLALVATTAVAGSSGRNEVIVRQMIEAINARDFAALDGLVAADVERHSAATPEFEVHSLEAFKAFLHHDLEAVPDARQDVKQLLVDGDMVAVRVIYSGHQTGPMGPYPPTGRAMELPYLGMLRIADGKIAEIWVEWDNLSALTQLGHWPPPTAAAEEEAKAVARRWFTEVINDRDLDALADIYADDYVYHGAGGMTLSGLAAVREFAAAILASSNDRHAVVERQVAEGHRVVTQFTSRGTRTGPFQGRPATGKEWVTEGIVISRVEDGRIAEDWEVTRSTEPKTGK